ncbi:hypothetical protein QFC21_001134 [Naganishia friedmannii]|uniref:Uncharacterized protein n=1 Tax=Naganishia friedmannii TaxID=89922 RepID=A0ACC2W8Z4_9TREE|nr:hypothetical protein QFC21_001134 [Naganishia friedmannii]
MPTDLPYAADAEESLAFDELEVLRNQYEKEQVQKHVTTQTKFNYGMCAGLTKNVLIAKESPLIESSLPRSLSMYDRQLGEWSSRQRENYRWRVSSFFKVPSLIIRLCPPEIYASVQDYRRECSYYIALGYYKLGNYGHARRFNDLLLHVEPSNMQAQSLKALIDQAETREGYIGIGLVAGAAALGGLVVASLVKSARKR